MWRLNKLSPRSFDWWLFGAALLLAMIGLAAIYSVDLSRGSELVNFRKQLFALILGMIFFFTVSLTQYTWFRSGAKFFYWASLAMLIAVLFLGKNIRGTTGWFALPGFSFQPVEVAKIALILLLAYVVSNFGRRFERPLFFLGSGVLTFLPVALIILQPDLGSALLLIFVWFGLMLLVGARWRQVILFALGVILVAIFSWFFLFKDYQKARLVTFVDPNRDPLNTGYNVVQSMIAVGAGQVTGRGLGFGSQSQLRFLPEAQTDFVFAVIGEELGFFGAMAVILLYGLIFWRLIVLARTTSDDFISASVSGTALLFLAQFTVNIGASIGLLPVTGVTLPLVSYGGSSLLMTWVLLGIMESMVVKRY